MKLITQFEPKITQYMVPATLGRIDFYGQGGVDIYPSATTKSRELTIVELLEDESQTRFLTFNSVAARENHFADLVDEQSAKMLQGGGEWERFLDRRVRTQVPQGIPIKTEPVLSQMALSIRADWWEVTW